MGPKGRHVYLADFGMACRYKRQTVDDDEELTRVCGTLDFFPPEILYETGPYTPKGDVWAVGSLMYLMLVGFVPFSQGYNMSERRGWFDTTELYFPDHVSDSAKDLLTRLLEFDVSNRFSFEDALEHDFIASNSSI